MFKPDCRSHDIHQSVEPDFHLIFTVHVLVEVHVLAVLGDHRVGQVRHLVFAVHLELQLGHRVEQFGQMFGDFERLVSV